VLTRYCRGIDRVDKDLLLSVYHPGATDDHGIFCGPAEEFADFAVKTLKAEICTAHVLGQTDIRFDGNTAYAETYCSAYHLREIDGKPNLYSMCGRYIDRFENRNGEWRIADRKVLMDWVDQRIVSSVGLTIDAFSRGKRSRDDESYLGR
jgi:SnoaL-like domain